MNDKIQKRKEDIVYQDLTPSNQIKPEEESIQALRWAIENPNVKNIALSGPYGSGKSSVIQSYLKEYDVPKRYSKWYMKWYYQGVGKIPFLERFIPKSSERVLQISLATFGEKNLNKDNKKEELQRGILKQLFYKVNASKIPLSRYRKLQHISGIKYVIASIMVGLFILAGAYVVFPEATYSFLIGYWKEIGKLERIRRVVALLGMLGGVSYLLRVCTSRFRIKSIAVGDITAEGMNLSEESILDQNLDEIVYFFEKTKYNLVFIEDLDRFNNTEIFTNLRELNDTLNNYEVLKKRGKITFVYAVKDELFKVDTERTKFFDFIVPVIPYMNETNSDQVMNDLLKIGDQYEPRKEEEQHEISKEYVKQVYPYIGDMRLLINTINEFWVYKRILKKDTQDKLNDEKMMSLMIYKNSYPQDFAALEEEKGVVKEAFEQKERLIREKEEKLKCKKENINKLQEDAANSVREIKLLILAELKKVVPTDGHSLKYNVKVGYSEQAYLESEILADEFTMDVFRQENVEVNIEYRNQYRHIERTEFITEPEHSNARLSDLFARYDLHKKYEIISVEETKRELEKTDKEIQNLHATTLSQLLANRDMIAQMPAAVKENELLVFLLRKGYIDENYADYINYFREGTISKAELNFIRTVRNNQGECNFDFTIVHPANVIEKLFDYEFEQPELLNYSLMDYMLEYIPDDKKLRILLNQVVNRSENSRQFILGYLSRKNQTKKFVEQILMLSSMVWKDIEADSILTEEQKYIYLNEILCFGTIEGIVSNNYKESETDVGIIRQRIEKEPDIFEKLPDVVTEKWIQILGELEIDFFEVHLQKTDRKIVDFIITNWNFQLNRYMMKEIFMVCAPKYLPLLFLANYYCLQKLANNDLLEYVNEYMKDYVENVTLGVETNTKENKENVERMLGKLLDTDLPLCGKIIEKEHNVHWDALEDCLSQREDANKLWKFLLQYDRITANWQNCIAYYELNEEVDATLRDYVDRNIDSICERNENDNLPHDFLRALLMCDVSYKTFDTLTRIPRLTPFDCECTAFNEDRLLLMIQRGYLLFSVEILEELKEISEEIWLAYIDEYKKEFLENLQAENLGLEDVKIVLDEMIFVGEDENTVLQQIKPSEIDDELAEILYGLRTEECYEKPYVEAVWNVLPDECRYSWLCKHMGVYDQDELAEHFAQLANTYHALAERTDHNHKYRLHNSEYNRILCEKLKKRGYITGVTVKGNYLEGYVRKK
ncbi:YobI family P-loop NTPase [Coprococcus comes]|uniref:YobI family P-loop NTPase n=1 Tax=Coprococcus comes TaxID=410072 RepID=UPI00189BBFE7|nr:hypothetical protein [Coprococcus comes]